MFQQTSFTNQLTFFQKIKALDFILILCVLVLGVVGTFSMYSSEGGQFLYYTKNHIIRFTVFFSFMLFFSFVRLTYFN